MLTEKLFERDSYLTEFDAKVLRLESDGAVSRLVLDRTAFFPEGGGQYADRGTLSGLAVTDVQIIDGEIVHTVDGVPNADIVHGVIDFSVRYRRMQNHTGEHIVSGIVHRLFGYDNVGFHLSDDDVTLDFSGELTREQLAEVERLANLAVWQNSEIRVTFPSPSELTELDYRSKLELTENVRIVSVGEVDVCACCAPHVARTGEIGLIKLLDSMRYKGGIRLHILCGKLALSDYGMRYRETLALSQLLSVKQHELSEAVERLLARQDEMKQELRQLRREHLAAMVERLPEREGNRVIVLSADERDLVREAVNLSLHLSSGATVAVAGEGNGPWRYAIGSSSVDLRSVSREINAALDGRGGGSQTMIEGSFSATLDEIKAYFETTDLSGK